jgi:hypothetical protein
LEGRLLAVEFEVLGIIQIGWLQQHEDEAAESGAGKES